MQLPGERRDVGLGGTDERAAGLDRLVVLAGAGQVVVEHPPADPVARLDQQHAVPPAGHLARRDEAGDAGPDHHDVDRAGQVALQRAGRGGGVRRRQGAGAQGEAAQGGATEQGAAGEWGLGHLGS